MSAPSVTYLTTAIDYANGPPHIGHALEKVGADAIARYLRLKGEAVHFVIGMDEHGLKVLQTAQAAGISPREWVDDIAARFASLWRTLGISNDDFIRTTEPRHHRAVEEMIRRMKASDDLYLDTYSGYYCVGCEAYKTEDELVPAGADAAGEGGGAGAPAPGGATRPAAPPDASREVENLRCPIHPTRTILWMEEENWFFRLSRYQDRLLQLYEEQPGFIQPEIRRNEIRRVVEAGLEDISVSRKRLPWGVPWPGSPEHTVYVWIDALTNYLSAIGFPDPEYRRYWPAALHVIGKDITRFHCVYWPAMLMSAGLPLPRCIWAHGFVNFEGGKLSKSTGVGLDLGEAVQRHGPEPFRYYLLRDIPWNGDGDFSWNRFDERYTAELADDLGNLANRTLSMIERYRSGSVPAGGETALDERRRDAVARYTQAMDAHLLHQGAAVAMELTAAANGFVEERAPWHQAKDPAQADALDATLASLARAVVALASLLSPFMPGTMRELASRFGLDAPPDLAALPDLDLAGQTVHRGNVLFPKETP